jgi:hypothetical protein
MRSGVPMARGDGPLQVSVPEADNSAKWITSCLPTSQELSLYYPVVRQGYTLRTLRPEAPFVDGVLRIERILLHPTRFGSASHGTARRTCPIIKGSETVDGFVATPSTRTGPVPPAISGLNRRSLPGPSRA